MDWSIPIMHHQLVIVTYRVYNGLVHVLIAAADGNTVRLQRDAGVDESIGEGE